jgi:hypothetical protein
VLAFLQVLFLFVGYYEAEGGFFGFAVLDAVYDG